MKKQHFYRLSAILLFLCIFLEIMPRHALQTNAAEAENTFPMEGKIYGIRGTSPNGREETYQMLPLIVHENGRNDSFLDSSHVPESFVDLCFSFEEVEDGVFKILPVSMPGWCLQLGESALPLMELAVHAAVFENKPEQLWTLKQHEDGYYLSCMSAPDQVLGNHNAGVQPVSIDSKNAITFYFEEKDISFPDSRIHVKAPEGWHPGLWVTPATEEPPKWAGFTIMEKNANGWFSYPAPWYTECDIINHAKVGVAAQIYKHDEEFTLEDMDFSTDKWVVISDDPNVDGDLSYKLYDYNPDEEPPKTADPVMLAVPAFTLLASTIAMAWLFRRKRSI